MSVFGNLFNRSRSTPAPARISSECQPVTKGQAWFKWFLIFLFFAYWLFAVYFERVDLTERFVEQFPGLPPNIIFVTIREMVSLQVLRHLIPVAVGWWLAYETAVSVVQQLYDLPDASSARRFLGRIQSDSPGSDLPLAIDPKTLEAARAHHVMLRVGGPGKIKLPPTYVGVTEMNDRFCRILSPGKNTLKPFEYLRTVLDLRQQDRFRQKVELVSLDGISFHASINIVYRIKTGEPPTQQKPYPYDPEAVRQLAYTETVLNDAGAALTWEVVPELIAGSTLKGIVRKYRLDQIFYADTPAEALYEIIQGEFKQKVFRAFSNIGIEMREAHVVNMELPDDVKQGYFDYWQSQSNMDIKIKRTRSKAAQLEKLEIARVEAEETMITAIMEGINRARQSGGTSRISEIVALRLVEALERMSTSAPDTRLEHEKYLPPISDFHYELHDDMDEPEKDTAES